jgi:hypothetical protein
MYDPTFIQDQLKNLPGTKKPGPNSTFILCPFHVEKTPSARVFHSNGFLKCYGCGAAKSYNDWAPDAGLEKSGKQGLPKSGEAPLVSESRFLDALFSEKKSSRDRNLELIDLDDELAKRIGVSRRWRGFKTTFLSSIGAKIAFDVDSRRHYIWLPVFIRGKLKGNILAQIKKPTSKEIPSYLNSPGTWSLKYGLFPFDSAIACMKSHGLSSLVVVEGPRDALRLLSLGYPAVSMLGTHSWTDTKSRMIEMSGVDRVIVMLDGDKAGRQATRFLRTGKRTPTAEPTIRPLPEFFETKIVRLWNLDVDPDHSEDKYDPGNLPEDVLLSILRKTVK